MDEERWAKQREYQRQYRHAHKEKAQKYGHEYYLAHREEMRAYQHEYYEAHKAGNQWQRPERKRKHSTNPLEKPNGCVYPDCFNCKFSDCVAS